MNEKQTPKYHSVVLLVSDVAKSKKFYQDILNQKIENDFGRCIGFIGGFSIWEKSYAHKMMGKKDKNPLETGNEFELYFEIEDLDAFLKILTQRKIKFVHNIFEQPWGQRCFRIYDPDYHIIEFAESMNMVIERLYNKGFTHNQIINKTLMSEEIVLDAIAKIDSVKNDKYSEKLIAACGMNCRICIGYFGYTMNGKKRKMKCIGCTPRDKSCAFLKKYCKKLTKKEVNYCYECDDFPCVHLKKIDSLYQNRYNMSMIKNLKYIRDKGMNSFLKQQEKTYRCPNCGGVICVHNRICYSCNSIIDHKP
jgi:catechol 2,3-dioxygenase-like lactoylglutathione lyase family enzyme